MQANGRQPQRAPGGAPVHYDRHRPEQTTRYRLFQQHAATFIAQVEDAAGADLPQFVKDEFDAFLECGIAAHGFLRLRLRLRCGDSGPVLVGRATLYGAVAAGGPGAQRALVILRNEIERAMRLCGVTRVADIDGGLLAP